MSIFSYLQCQFALYMYQSAIKDVVGVVLCNRVYWVVEQGVQMYPAFVVLL